MPTAFIFHGIEGNPNENWFPWLKRELENLNQQVFIPQFPTPENQTLENWLNVMKKYEKYINEDTIFIGHSLGVAFALNLIERYKIKAAFFIAGFYGKCNDEFDDMKKTFTQREFDWEKIKSNCRKFYIFHSDNDPYVKLEKAEQLAEKLGVDVILVKGAGHFNEAAGYKTFDMLFSYIKNEI